MIRRVILFTVAVWLTLSLFGVAQAQPSKPPLRIGLLYPFSGALAYAGAKSMQGIQMAADMINEKGGVQGRQIVLVKGDTVSPQAAMSEAERLIKIEKVPVIMGSFSSAAAQTASQVAERNKVIYWEMTAAADKLTERGFKYFFRPSVKASSYGSIAADFAAEIAGPRLGKTVAQLKVDVIHESSLFGTELSQWFIKRAKERGMNISEVMKYESKDRDFSSIIMRLKNHETDVLFDACYLPDFVLFLRQCKELGYSPKVLLSGGTLLDQELIDALGNDVNGILPCFSAEADIAEGFLRPEAQANRREYFKRMQQSKYTGPCSSCMLCYDAAQIFFNHVLTVVKNPDDPEEIRAAILNLDLPLGSSILGYGAKFVPPGKPDSGQNERAFAVVMQWQDKTIRLVYPGKMATTAPILPLLPWDKRK
jgi:branched-chain amino acid transport system substrate-binding protein